MGGTKQIVGPEKLHGYKPGTILWRDLFDDPGTVTYLLFDSDWDWLMPVVERIERLGFATKFRYEAFTSGKESAYHDIEIFSLNENNGYMRVACCTERIPKKEAVYKAVVAFIIWYNSHN